MWVLIFPALLTIVVIGGIVMAIWIAFGCPSFVALKDALFVWLDRYGIVLTWALFFAVIAAIAYGVVWRVLP